MDSAKLKQGLLVGGGVVCVLGALALDAFKPGSDAFGRLLAAMPLILGGVGVGWGAFNKPGQPK